MGTVINSMHFRLVCHSHSNTKNTSEHSNKHWVKLRQSLFRKWIHSLNYTRKFTNTKHKQEREKLEYITALWNLQIQKHMKNDILKKNRSKLDIYISTATRTNLLWSKMSYKLGIISIIFNFFKNSVIRSNGTTKDTSFLSNLLIKTTVI